MGKQNNISIPIDLKKENLKIKLKKARLRISFKISRIIKENVEKCFHQSTRVDFYLMGLKNAVINDKKKFKYISMLLKKGNYIASYIPFIPKQTKAYIYNYFSTSYGLRSNGHLLMILVDENFTIFDSKIIDFNLRDSKLIDIEEDFKTCIKGKKAAFFLGIQINQRIPKNHGSNTWTKVGGINRFWGIWNDGASFNHSRYIPHPSKFIRKKYYFQEGKPLERLNYSKNAHKIIHYGPFSKLEKISQRGDLSGKIRLEAGYTIYFDQNQKVKAAFHQNYPFNSRFLRHKEKNEYIKHVIAIPPGKDIDLEMYFGECCDEGSRFKLELFEYSSKDNYSKSYEHFLNVENIDQPFSLSEIIPNFNFLDLGGWVTFEALDGKHDKKFINNIYKSRKGKNVFDGVHSHNFSKGYEKYGSRTLKFSPFLISKDTALNEKVESWVAIFGSDSKKIDARIRLYDQIDNGFEKIELITINPNQVKFFNLDDIRNEKNDNKSKSAKKINQYGICQIETESINLNCNLYIVKKKKNSILSIGVDHFTGG